MASNKQRVHREHIRPVALRGRKSCPNCRTKLAVPQYFSWGEYVRAKWRTVLHFCQTCYKDDVEKKLVTHALQCGCTFELVGHGLETRELPGWIQLPPMDLRGMPTLAQCVRVAGPVEEWKGRCAEIATVIAAKFLDDKGYPRYGAWLGGVHSASYFAARRSMPFIRHGWFELTDGRVFDPTRWVFEAAEPYLYVGPAGVYDAGMAKAKAVLGGYREPPAFDPKERRHLTTTNEHFDAVAATYFPDNPPGEIAVGQIYFLANLPPQLMPGRDRIKGVYDVVVALGFKAAIPLDFQEMFLKPVTAKQALAAAGYPEGAE